MLFQKNKSTEHTTKGLYAPLEDLIEQKKYLPYIKSKHNNLTSYQAGDIRSAFKGRGMELEEVRVYGFGDDVRDIDWRVTARKGETYTKIFSEEKDREVYVVLDLSPHMLFGTKKELKSVSASKLAALLGWQSMANKDRFGLLLFDGVKTRTFKPQNNPKSLMAIFKTISDVGEAMISSSKILEENEDLAEPLHFLQYGIKSRAMVFVISDFNNITEEVKKTLAILARRCRVYCINVYDVIEEIPPESGEYMAAYKEEKLVFSTENSAFKDTYYHYFMQKRKEMENFCKRFGCQYLNVRTDRPLYKQLKIL